MVKVKTLRRNGVEWYVFEYKDTCFIGLNVGTAQSPDKMMHLLKGKTRTEACRNGISYTAKNAEDAAEWVKKYSDA